MADVGQLPIEECDLAIIGAGIAGMNALAVACRYLSPEQRVILIDRRPRVGGMWLDTYPYVRLHQPHEFFTAGNIPWEQDVQRSHLSTRGEVLDHFDHCLRMLRGKVVIDTYFGYTASTETETDDGVTIRLTGADGPDDAAQVHAERLIVATGFNIAAKEPLALSSRRVRSISPDHDDLSGPEFSSGDDPMWVIGGGKTGMDTVLAVIDRCPGREVHLVAGSGTAFLDRDEVFPDGAVARWIGGTRPMEITDLVAARFDGSNGEEIMRRLLASGVLHSFVAQPKHFLNGVASESEVARVRENLRGIHTDHLVDAVDRGKRVELVFRSGATTAVPAGTWIVNCTSYFGKTPGEYSAAVSPSGSVIRVDPRCGVLMFSTYSAYFLTHLLFLGRVHETPLYELDADGLLRASPENLPWIMYTLTTYNLGLIADQVPNSVFNGCGLDFDKWYPKPRQVAGAMKFMALRKRRRPRQKAVLDAVGERYGVRCRPLTA